MNAAIFNEITKNNAPKLLSHLALENFDILNIKLENHTRSQLIENPDPFLKRIILASEIKDTKISNVFYFSREPIFPFQEKEFEGKSYLIIIYFIY